MPLYIGDYLKDTMRLSTEQHGAYLLLLMEYWCSGPLPDDDDELASICRLPINTWRSHRPKLARFFTIEGGVWRQNRADKEVSAAESRRKAARQNGKKGGRPRKENKPPNNPNPNPEKTHGFSVAKPTANPDHNPEKSSSPSPSSSQEKIPVPGEEVSRVIPGLSVDKDAEW